jgi:uncharacterized membrane protein YuzA (DUF378 family)
MLGQCLETAGFPSDEPFSVGEIIMKTIDVVAAVLLVVGGLNWGLVGATGFDLVATLFGDMSAPSRIVYVLVGLAGLYQAMQFRGIQRRWSPQVARA